MKRTTLLLVLLSALTTMVQGQNRSHVVSPKTNATYVNVFIGTNGMGHTFPGACFPYGSVQLSPDTDTIPHNVRGVYQPRAYDYCAGYQYADNTIVGFSHTHFSGTGHSDLGDLLLMPYSGATQLRPGTRQNPDGGYRQRFSHATEFARPGYYSVTLDDSKIECELTATEHCGVHRYTFPRGAEQKLLLDLSHGLYNYDGKVLWAQCNVVIDPNRTPRQIISGYRITNGWSRTNYTYFAIYVNKPIRHYGCHDFGPRPYNGFWGRFDTEHDFPEMGGRKLVTWFEFDDQGDPQLEVLVALSATSAQAAADNLMHDIGLHAQDCAEGHYFDCLRQYNEQAWNQHLNRFSVQGTDDAKAVFFTSLYHTLINPSLYMDADGHYRGIDQEVHTTSGRSTNYSVFSVWDTYRAFHPLLTLLDGTLTNNIVASFYRHFEQSPHRMLPVWSHAGSENWCMIGYHGVSVLADALSKGFTGGISPSRLLEAMKHSANCPYYSNTDTYIRLGYVPFELNPSATSVTLENAYEDWCIYNTLRQQQAPAADIEAYRRRALSYQNVFHPQLGFVRARLADGSWKTPYSLLSTSGEGLIEGNAWNYSFYVPHDVKGLMHLMGGDKAFLAKLDTLFTMHVPDQFFAQTEDVTREGMLGGYVHGNEPSHHIPYLYMWTSQPWKTQYWVREIMNRMYRNHIDGLCGNDDCGQMSAWYIFSAMGFYPVCPASGQYVLGAPYLPYLKVTLANGQTLEIKAPKVSDANRYVQAVRLNGKTLTQAYLTHQQLMQGGILEFDMGPKPNKRLFQSAKDKPYSLSE